MFRKPTKKANIRQKIERKSSSDEDSAEVVKDFQRRKRRANPMVQSTKKAKDNDGGSSSSSSESDDGDRNEFAFATTGSSESAAPKDMGATATLNIDTDFSADAQAQFERVQKQLDEGLEKDGKTLYKGQAMYGAKKAKDNAKGNASSGLNRIGPVRAPQFLRQTVRWDYAPDICKDYKETGFCTFGDSCKFLHDRSDYKHGWEIERDHAAGRLDQVDNTDYEIHEDDDGFPEECYICLQAFVDPVVTRCKHYFCESCALKAFKVSKRCKICNEITGGVFNIAKDLRQHLAGESKKRVKEEDEDSESPEEEDEHAGHSCDQKLITKEEIKEETEELEDAYDLEEDIKQEIPEDAEEQEAEVQEVVDIAMEEVPEEQDIENESDAEDDETSDHS